MYGSFGKRLFDFILAAAGLIILSPLFVLLGLCIFSIDGQKPFFYQPRPGFNGKIFIILKFKTMRDLRDTEGKLLPDSQRITRLGKFLRQTALDELPQLWNVWIGDMSLVGPRPLLPEYLLLYSPAQMRRHHVKPGITGLAQINGRNSINWSEKFRHDLWYVDNLSFQLDLTILFLTLTRAITTHS
jgi:lipopolysaccharide/colanic/teichoic acid biosynthesis glycosyltransferase